MTNFLTEEQRETNEKLAARIANLIAKAESTTNENEASAFMAKAEELMVKHMIDRADLEARGKIAKEPITSVTFNFPHAKCYFTSMVYFGGYTMVKAMGLADLTYLSGTEMYSLWGTASDIKVTQQMLESMWKQALAARKFWVQTDIDLMRIRNSMGTNNTTYWNAIYQFLRGYCVGMASKVEASRRQVVAETTGAELVLATRSAEIEQYKKSNGVGKGRARGTGVGFTNAYAKGKSEGLRANIGNQVSK